MILLYVEHAVVGLVVLALIGVHRRAGWREVFRMAMLTFKQIPGVNSLIAGALKSEASSFIKTTKLASKEGGKPLAVVLPEKGLSKDEVLKKIEGMRTKEVNHLEGKTFAYTYTVHDDLYDLQKDVFDRFTEKTGFSPEHDDLIKYIQRAYLHANALNPMVCPSLRQMETEVVSMTAAMLNGDSNCVGFVTSGGTESVLMAVKAFRNRAKELWPWITKPNIVCPVTQHPVIGKAAHYFGMTITYVPVGPDLVPDVQEMEKAITPNTVLIACSAPQFCHGIVDPVEEISNMAAKHGLPCHVDACFGGYMLPWVEKMGHQVPKWDFRCPGVSSISADVHKYGYCVKGASVVVYRSDEMRKHQIYTFGGWPGGLYGSPSMAGTRPGSNIAAAWAAMTHIGVDGYMNRAKQLMDITDTMKQGVQSVQGVKIMGHPHMTCFAIGSDDPDVDIMAVADLMEKKGWTIERNQKPNSIHCSILPHHEVSSDQFVLDLKECVGEAKGNKKLSKEGTAGMYGMMATIPDGSIVEDFIREFFSEVYKIQ